MPKRRDPEHALNPRDVPDPKFSTWPLTIRSPAVTPPGLPSPAFSRHGADFPQSPLCPLRLCGDVFLVWRILESRQENGKQVAYPLGYRGVTHSVKCAYGPEQDIWNRFFHVTPLVLVTTISRQGRVDVAPKTQCTRIGGTNYIGLGCEPGDHTMQNVAATGEFVVNYPGPEIARQSGQAGMKFDESTPDEVAACGLTTTAAKLVRPPLVAECRAHLECRLVDIRQYGNGAFVVGEVLAAAVEEEALADQGISALGMAPLLVYVYPNHFAGMHVARKFPFPDGVAG